jgi:hypothetical protein
VTITSPEPPGLLFDVFLEIVKDYDCRLSAYRADPDVICSDTLDDCSTGLLGAVANLHGMMKN